MNWQDDTGDDHDLNEGLDPDGPSAEDLHRFGDEMSVCPSCNSEIYDQAELCHVCGHMIERESSGPPAWVVVAAVLVIIGLLLIAI
ncbi:MAG: hypothetical protein ACI89L_002158 [Phycisphaerales bacterium]|jgi:hypothetical protein